jgi:hypothetical protein
MALLTALTGTVLVQWSSSAGDLVHNPARESAVASEGEEEFVAVESTSGENGAGAPNT